MSFVSLVKLKVRLPDSAGVTPVPLEGHMTASDLIELVAGALKEHDKDISEYKLVIPPSFNKEHAVVIDKEASIQSFKLDSKDILELWVDPLSFRLSIARENLGTPSDEKTVTLDAESPLKTMIPSIQRVFSRYIKASDEFSFMYAEDTNANARWLNINQSLAAQEVKPTGHIVVVPINTITKFIAKGAPFFSAIELEGELIFSGKQQKSKDKAKKRWCVLRDNFFYFFGSKADAANRSAAKGIMILDHFLLKEDEPQGQEAPPYYFSLMKDAQPFSFSLKASDASVSIRPATSKKSEKSVRVIATDSLEELKKWRSAMQAKCINSNPNRVFGVHITNLLKRKDAQLIPAVMVKTIEQIEKEGLQTEGVFRLCGSRAEIDELKKQFDKGNNKIDLSEYSIHSVAGLLKLYLRELPEPILTFELYDCFIAAHGKLIEKSTRVPKMVDLLSGLPRANYIILKHLIMFLARVEKHSDENKMGLMNLATCFGPNLLKFQKDASQGEEEMMGSLILDTPVVNEITSTLIQHGEEIFRIVEEKYPQFRNIEASDLMTSGKVTLRASKSASPSTPTPTSPHANTASAGTNSPTSANPAASPRAGTTASSVPQSMRPARNLPQTPPKKLRSPRSTMANGDAPKDGPAKAEIEQGVPKLRKAPTPPVTATPNFRPPTEGPEGGIQFPSHRAQSFRQRRQGMVISANIAKDINLVGIAINPYSGEPAKETPIAIEEKPKEEKPKEEKPTEQKPKEEKPMEQKPTEEKRTSNEVINSPKEEGGTSSEKPSQERAPENKAAAAEAGSNEKEDSKPQWSFVSRQRSASRALDERDLVAQVAALKDDLQTEREERKKLEALLEKMASRLDALEKEVAAAKSTAKEGS